MSDTVRGPKPEREIEVFRSLGFAGTRVKMSQLLLPRVVVHHCVISFRNDKGQSFTTK